MGGAAFYLVNHIWHSIGTVTPINVMETGLIQPSDVHEAFAE